MECLVQEIEKVKELRKEQYSDVATANVQVISPTFVSDATYRRGRFYKHVDEGYWNGMGSTKVRKKLKQISETSQWYSVKWLADHDNIKHTKSEFDGWIQDLSSRIGTEREESAIIDARELLDQIEGTSRRTRCQGGPYTSEWDGKNNEVEFKRVKQFLCGISPKLKEQYGTRGPKEYVRPSEEEIKKRAIKQKQEDRKRKLEEIAWNGVTLGIGTGFMVAGTIVSRGSSVSCFVGGAMFYGIFALRNYI